MSTTFHSITTRVGVGMLLLGCSGGEAASPGVSVPPGYVQRTIGFEARVGSEPFSCAGRYELGTPPSEARPNQFRLFVSELAVLDADGDAVPVLLDEDAWQSNFAEVGESVALLDFDDATGNCRFADADTHTAITGWVPGNTELVGLSFRIGVPPSLNHRDAGLAPPPLNRPGLWWSRNAGHVSLRLELDTVNADSHRTPTVDDRTAPGGWQLWLAQTVVVAPYPRGVDPASTPGVGCVDELSGLDACPEDRRPQVVLEAFDSVSDRVALDVAALLQDVDFTRAEFDPRPEERTPVPTDPTVTGYPMPDYAPGFFMERIDGEGAVVLGRLGLDWLTLGPPDASRQVFARRAE